MSAVLALDLGTRAGFALLRADGKIESGEVRLEPKKGEHPGVRFNKFRRWLVETNACHPIGRVAYEDVMFMGSRGGFNHTTNPLLIYGGLLAVVLSFADHHAIECKGYNVATIKKQFAGSGKAQKVDMIAQCRALGFKPEGHNEADAIALLHVATGRAPLLTMSGASPKKRTPKVMPELAPGVNPF